MKPLPLCIQKIKIYLDKHIIYEKLIIIDAVFAGVHLLVMFIVSIQYLMLITLLGIRAPRIFLWAYCKKTQQGDWFNREFKFRKYSTWFYFPIALAVQVTTLFTNYCLKATDNYKCGIGYFFTFLVLLLVYIPVDFFLYRMVLIHFNSKFPNGLPIPEIKP